MFTYTPHTIPSNIFIVGAGGTGSRVVQLLSQFLKSISLGVGTGWVPTPRIFLIDDDVVEHKNLARQLFIAGDVGKPKAVVVAERYSNAFKIPIHPLVQRLDQNTPESVFALEEIQASNPVRSRNGRKLETSIVVMCVDSPKARWGILKFIAKQASGIPYDTCPFIIDAGNEDTFGQVKIFHPYVATAGAQVSDRLFPMPSSRMHSAAISLLPLPWRHYEALVDEGGTRSCADLDQTMALNTMMAAQILSIVQSYYYRLPINFNQLSYSMLTGGSVSLNTAEYIRDQLLGSGDRPIGSDKENGICSWFTDYCCVDGAVSSRTVAGSLSEWCSVNMRTSAEIEKAIKAEAAKAELEQKKAIEVEVQKRVEAIKASLVAENSAKPAVETAAPSLVETTVKTDGPVLTPLAAEPSKPVLEVMPVKAPAKKRRKPTVADAPA